VRTDRHSSRMVWEPTELANLLQTRPPERDRRASHWLPGHKIWWSAESGDNDLL
jgi:hypothetical protein